MTCPKCANEKFKVIQTIRGRRIKNGRFLVNNNVDSRVLVCKLCGSRFVSESFITAQLLEKNFKLIIRDSQGEFDFSEYLEEQSFR